LTLAELRARFAAHDTISSSFAAPTEVLEDPQVKANGYLADAPGHPRARLTSAPVHFDGHGLLIRRRAPRVGEHTDEVLAEVGLDRSEIEQLRAAGAVV
jgi:crotonobetainyl-CoA:carnitine CoA-transferase CaiB-like acyl-CoA transferase